VSSLLSALAGAARELELEYAHEEQREIELTEHERWARDPAGWINTHVTIASVISEDGPRKRMRPVRMRLFPDQEATIAEWIDLDHLAETGELVFSNLIIEKSRQIGETWLFAAVLVWLLLFHPGLVGGALHTVGAEIDDGGERNTVKSLFGKVRYIVRRLPRAPPPAGVTAATRSGSGRCRTRGRRRWRTRRTAPSSTGRARRTTRSAARRSTTSWSTRPPASATASRCTPRSTTPAPPARPTSRPRTATRTCTPASPTNGPPATGTCGCTGRRTPSTRKASTSPRSSTATPARSSSTAPGLRPVRRHAGRARVDEPGAARAPLPRQAHLALVRAADHRQDRRAGRLRARHRP
jgi:hypothetical protein